MKRSCDVCVSSKGPRFPAAESKRHRSETGSRRVLRPPRGAAARWAQRRKDAPFPPSDGGPCVWPAPSSNAEAGLAPVAPGGSNRPRPLSGTFCGRGSGHGLGKGMSFKGEAPPGEGPSKWKATGR